MGRKELDYVGILKKSLATVWNNKVIWFFGILLTLLSGPPSLNFPSSSFNFGGSSSNGNPRIFRQIEHFFSTVDGGTIIGLIIVGIILMLFFITIFFLLSALMRGSIISLVSTVNEGGKPQARPALSVGWKKMLSIAGMSLLIIIPSLIVVVVVVALILAAIIIGALIATASSGSKVGLVLSILIAVVIGFVILAFFIVTLIAISLVEELAERFIVIGADKAVDSLRNAWKMLRKNLSQVVVSWFLMIAVGIVYSIIIVILFALFAIPVVLVGIKVSIIAAVVLAIPLLLLLLIPAGFWKAVTSSFWTYVYLALQDADIDSFSQEPPSETMIST